MRLKYFLRGVGVGIIVTTMILTIAHISNRKMTDGEIIERASELGMSFTTSNTETQPQSSSIEASQQDTDSVLQDEEPESDSEDADSQTKADENDNSTNEQPDGSEQSESTDEEVKAEETTLEVPAIEQSATNQAMTQDNDETSVQTLISCKLNIAAGMSSRAVCDMLKQNGIIGDAADFDRYLISKGYDDKIRTGEVEVDSGMSYEELAAVLYKKK